MGMGTLLRKQSLTPRIDDGRALLCHLNAFGFGLLEDRWIAVEITALLSPETFGLSSVAVLR